jgi:hypothetical protein
MGQERASKQGEADRAQLELQAQEALITELAMALQVQPAELQPTEMHSLSSLVRTALLRTDFSSREAMTHAAIAIFERHGQYFNAFSMGVGLSSEGIGAEWALDIYNRALAQGLYRDAYNIACRIFKPRPSRTSEQSTANWLENERAAFELYAREVLNSNPTEYDVLQLYHILQRNGYWGYSSVMKSPLCSDVALKLLEWDKECLRADAAHQHACLAGLPLVEADAIRAEINEQRRFPSRVRRGVQTVRDLFGAVGEV